MFHILKTRDIIEDSIPPAPSADFLQREMPQLSEALEKLLCYIYHDGCLGFTRSVSGNTRHHIYVSGRQSGCYGRMPTWPLSCNRGLCVHFYRQRAIRSLQQGAVNCNNVCPLELAPIHSLQDCELSSGGLGTRVKGLEVWGFRV